MAFLISFYVMMIGFLGCILSLFGYQSSMSLAQLNWLNADLQAKFKDRAYIFTGGFAVSLFVTIVAMIIMILNAPELYTIDGTLICKVMM